MRGRYSIVLIIGICAHIFSWYFITAFCSVYSSSGRSMLYGTVVSMIIDFLVNYGKILGHGIIRQAAKLKPHEVTKKIYTLAINFL